MSFDLGLGLLWKVTSLKNSGTCIYPVDQPVMMHRRRMGISSIWVELGKEDGALGIVDHTITY